MIVDVLAASPIHFECHIFTLIKYNGIRTSGINNSFYLLSHRRKKQSSSRRLSYLSPTHTHKHKLSVYFIILFFVRRIRQPYMKYTCAYARHKQIKTTQSVNASNYYYVDQMSFLFGQLFSSVHVACKLNSFRTLSRHTERFFLYHGII